MCSRDGSDGGKGKKGVVGTYGPADDQGDASVPGNAARNRKQCVWKSVEGKYNGLLKVFFRIVAMKHNSKISLTSQYAGYFALCMFSVDLSVF